MRSCSRSSGAIPSMSILCSGLTTCSIEPECSCRSAGSMRAIFARSIRACLLSLMLILTLRTPAAAPSIVRSSISIDFSEAICSRVAVPKSTTQRTVGLHRDEVADVAEGDQRELADDAVAGDSVAIKGGRETSFYFGPDCIICHQPCTLIVGATLTEPCSDRCLGRILRYEIGLDKQVLLRCETHARQLLIHLRPRSKLTFLPNRYRYAARALQSACCWPTICHGR